MFWPIKPKLSHSNRQLVFAKFLMNTLYDPHSLALLQGADKGPAVLAGASHQVLGAITGTPLLHLLDRLEGQIDSGVDLGDVGSPSLDD